LSWEGFNKNGIVQHPRALKLDEMFKVVIQERHSCRDRSSVIAAEMPLLQIDTLIAAGEDKPVIILMLQVA